MISKNDRKTFLLAGNDRKPEGIEEKSSGECKQRETFPICVAIIKSSSPVCPDCRTQLCLCFVFVDFFLAQLPTPVLTPSLPILVILKRLLTKEKM